MLGENTNWNIAIVVIDVQRKKKWWSEIWSCGRCRGKEKGRLQESVRKWNWPSVLDPHSTIKACCLNLSLFFWKNTLLFHIKAFENTQPPPPPPPPPLCWWRTVGVSNIVTVWTNNLNISDVRHRYENTHIKAYLCVCESNTSRCFHTHFTARPSSTFSTDWIYVLSIELSVSGLIKTICFLSFFHLNCIKIKQLA